MENKDKNNISENGIIEEDVFEDDFSGDDFFDDEDDFTPPHNTDDNTKDTPQSFDDDYDEAKAERTAEKEAAKQRRREKRRAFFKKAAIPVLILLAVLVCTFIAFFVYALNSLPSDRVADNVYIENLDVSGLSYEEALASVNATYLFENSEITLLSGEQTFSIKGIDIGLTAMPEDTTKKAFDYCKSGNFIKDGWYAMKLMFKKHVIVPAAQVDEARLDEKLNEFGNIVLGEKKQHYVEFGDDGMVTVFSGRTGYNMDPSEARSQILDAFSKERFNSIRVSFRTAPPDEMTVEAFDLLVYKDPVDARFEIEGNTVNIIPGDTGRYINKEEAAPLLVNVYEGCEPVKIPFYVSYPAVTEQTLNDKLFADTLGSYSTSYGSSDSNRRANIARAASLINGKVLAPGEVFSFNDTVGHRTKANGFYSAKEYVNGESVDGIGGGTCQVSSTLYSAVLYADMSIVERLNHMMTVGYIPLGQDATVADGSVDFKFKNSSDYPVKISAYTSGATVTISIIGTQWEPARKVKISNNVTNAANGNTIVYSKRYVYAGDELISTDTLNSSTYMPHKP